MSGEMAAIGDGERGLCRNCGTRLAGAHCHACGQAGHVHSTVGAIGHELAHGVFHFEGRIVRTLPMLVLHPGALTRRYIAGERMRFVSPLALFLFTVFLMFAVVANLPGSVGGGLDDITAAGGVERARADVDAELARVRADVARDEQRLTELRRKPGVDPGEPERIAARLAERRQTVVGLERAQQVLPATGTAAVPKAESWIDAKWRHAKENPKLLLYKLKSSAYKYSWALIPLSLPFIWLLFPFRRDVGLYDHAVFATYSLSFMSLLVVVLAVLSALGVSDGLVLPAAFLVPPIHIYKQLKGAYGLSRPGALWRTAWMLVFALFASMAFALLLLTVNLAE